MGFVHRLLSNPAKPETSGVTFALSGRAIHPAHRALHAGHHVADKARDDQLVLRVQNEAAVTPATILTAKTGDTSSNMAWTGFSSDWTADGASRHDNLQTNDLDETFPATAFAALAPASATQHLRQERFEKTVIGGRFFAFVRRLDKNGRPLDHPPARLDVSELEVPVGRSQTSMALPTLPPFTWTEGRAGTRMFGSTRGLPAAAVQPLPPNLAAVVHAMATKFKGAEGAAAHPLEQRVSHARRLLALTYEKWVDSLGRCPFNLLPAVRRGQDLVFQKVDLYELTARMDAALASFVLHPHALAHACERLLSTSGHQSFANISAYLVHWSQFVEATAHALRLKGGGGTDDMLVKSFVDDRFMLPDDPTRLALHHAQRGYDEGMKTVALDTLRAYKENANKLKVRKDHVAKMKWRVAHADAILADYLMLRRLVTVACVVLEACTEAVEARYKKEREVLSDAAIIQRAYDREPVEAAGQGLSARKTKTLQQEADGDEDQDPWEVFAAENGELVPMRFTNDPTLVKNAKYVLAREIDVELTPGDVEKRLQAIDPDITLAALVADWPDSKREPAAETIRGKAGLLAASAAQFLFMMGEMPRRPLSYQTATVQDVEDMHTALQLLGGVGDVGALTTDKVAAFPKHVTVFQVCRLLICLVC